MDYRFFQKLPATLLLPAIALLGLAGCADKNSLDFRISKLAEFSDPRGQANIKLFMYSGEVDVENIKAYTDTLGCNMQYAYFYPDTVPLANIPVSEISMASNYAEANEVLFKGEGYAKWHYAARCFAAIPIVSDCLASPLTMNCK